MGCINSCDKETYRVMEVQEPDIEELPIRQILQKGKFVPVDLQVYEKTDYKALGNLEQTQKENSTQDVIAEVAVASVEVPLEQAAVVEPTEEKPVDVEDKGERRKSMRSIGTQITLIVEDYTDSKNTEVNERKEYNITNYKDSGNGITNSQDPTQKTDTETESCEDTVTQTSETVSESVSEDRLADTAGSSSTQTLTDSYSETTQDDTTGKGSEETLQDEKVKTEKVRDEIISEELKTIEDNLNVGIIDVGSNSAEEKNDKEVKTDADQETLTIILKDSMVEPQEEEMVVEALTETDMDGIAIIGQEDSELIENIGLKDGELEINLEVVKEEVPDDLPESMQAEVDGQSTQVAENELDEIEELKKLIDEGDVEELSKAATKLQSNFRGFKTRKEMTSVPQTAQVPSESEKTSEEVKYDIEEVSQGPLENIEDVVGANSNQSEESKAEDAAVTEEDEVKELEKLIQEGDVEELSKAATKLQSNFRGFKARKEMKPVTIANEIAETVTEVGAVVQRSSEDVVIEDVSIVTEVEPSKSEIEQLNDIQSGDKPELKTDENIELNLEETKETEPDVGEAMPEETNVAEIISEAAKVAEIILQEANDAEVKAEVAEDAVTAETEEAKTNDIEVAETKTEDSEVIDTKINDVEVTEKTEGQAEDAEAAETKTKDIEVTEAKTLNAEVTEQKTEDSRVGEIITEIAADNTEIKETKLEGMPEVENIKNETLNDGKTEEEIEIEEMQKLIEEGDVEELTQAATRLQSSFRGFKARKEIIKQTSNNTDEISATIPTPIAEDAKSSEAVEDPNQNELPVVETESEVNTKETKTEEELEIEELKKLIQEGDVEELTQAATRLQSSFRGFKARKDVQNTTGLLEQPTEAVSQSKVDTIPEISNDPPTKDTPIEDQRTAEELTEIEELQKLIEEGDVAELSQAATRLQSNFRGFKARKEINFAKTNENETETAAAKEIKGEEADVSPDEIQVEAPVINPEVETINDAQESVIETVNGEEMTKAAELSEIEELEKLISEGDTEELSKAATKLQSNFRGFKSRKEMKTTKQESNIKETLTDSYTPKSEMDLIYFAEIRKLQEEFEQVKQKKSGLTFLDPDDNCFKELEQVEVKTSDPATYKIQEEGDVLPKNIAIDNIEKVEFSDGRRSVEVMAEEIAETVIDATKDVIRRTSSAMSIKSGALTPESVDENKTQQRPNIGEIIETVVEVMDYLMDTVAAEFDQKTTEDLNGVVAEVIEDLVSQVVLSVNGSEVDPVVLDLLDELITKVENNDTRQTRNILSDTGEMIEIVFTDPLEPSNTSSGSTSSLVESQQNISGLNESLSKSEDTISSTSGELTIGNQSLVSSESSIETKGNEVIQEEPLEEVKEDEIPTTFEGIKDPQNEPSQEVVEQIDSKETADPVLATATSSIENQSKGETKLIATSEDVGLKDSAISDIGKQENVESEASFVLEAEDLSGITLEEVIAPPNSPALLVPMDDLVDSESLVTPDSLDPATISRVDNTMSPDSLMEPLPRDPLFTPDSIPEEPEPDPEI